MKSDKFFNMVVQQRAKLKLTKQRRIERYQARKLRIKQFFKKSQEAKKNLEKMKFEKMQDFEQDVENSKSIQKPEKNDMKLQTEKTQKHKEHAENAQLMIMEAEEDAAKVQLNASVNDADKKDIQKIHLAMVQEDETDVKKMQMNDFQTVSAIRQVFQETYYNFEDYQRMRVVENLRKIYVAHRGDYIKPADEQVNALWIWTDDNLM